MNIYRLIREDGQGFAFEIENSYISRRKILKLLSAVDGVSNVVPRKLFSSSSDIHVEFSFQGENFVVWEPYGDSSRYWIGPKEENNFVDIHALEKVFSEYQPPMMVRILGNLITLNFNGAPKKTPDC